MKTVNSVSGGKSSAYLMANFPADFNVFALVRIEDKQCRFPDDKLRKKVEDRIQAPFVGTAEMDEIIYTIFDLEQFTGQKINWVTGITYEEVIKTKGGWLPNKLHRYCTTNLKIKPMFYWAADKGILPHIVRLGFRANESRRVLKTSEKCNENGFIEFKATFKKWKTGRHKGLNKWEMVEWQKPEFPLYENQIFKDDINNFWKNKPVRFAEINNCVGCFHRNEVLLNKLAHDPKYKNKMQWFANQEGGKNGTWKTGITYEEIMKAKLQLDLGFEEFSSCDAGYCGI